MDRNTLLKSTRGQFVSIFRGFIEDAIRRSLQTLFDKAEKNLNPHEHRQLIDARTFIARNERTLAEQILNNLNTLLDRSFKTAYDTFRPSFFDSKKTGPLMLLDISILEDDLRLDVITNGFRNAAGEQLRDLNIRIAVLFEREDIAERENPFRPYLLTRAIIMGIDAVHTEPDLLVIVTDQLAEELLRGIGKLYEGVNRHLAEAGVAAEMQYKSSRTHSANHSATHGASRTSKPNQKSNDDEDTVLTSLLQARKKSMPSSLEQDSKRVEPVAINTFAKVEQLLNVIKHGPSNPAQGLPSAQDDFPAIDSSLLDPPSSRNAEQIATGNGGSDGTEMGSALRRIFLEEMQPAASDAEVDISKQTPALSSTDANYVVISPKLNRALYTPLPSIDELVRQDGGVRNLLIEGRDQLNSIAANYHERITIDIVAMLFEFILNDQQVPSEVRAQLGRLQLSVLKMALMDPTLLTKKSHPVRLLVNRIGSIAVGLQQIDPTGERISQEICQIVEELLANDAESPELFSKMLDKLDSFIAKELLTSNTNVENAINVVANAENRLIRFDQISEQLEKLLRDIAVDPYLRQFLLDTWSRAIERTERDSTVPATRFRLLVPNLVWSVLPKIGQEDRYLLLQILPSFVSILREGMSLAGMVPEQQQELLNWLMDMHTEVMRNASDDANEQVALSLSEVKELLHNFVYPDDLASLGPIVRTKRDVQRSFVNEAIKEYATEANTGVLLEDLDKNPTLFSDSTLSEEASKELIANLTSGSDDDFEPLFDQVPSEYGVEAHNGTGTDREKNGEDILDRLRSGVVVEINLSGTPTLGRLNWISPNSSNLVLTIHGEEKPSLISVRMFRRLLKNSRARFIEVAPLFERAVQSLLEAADMVDLAHSS